jgi:hypothetical protein
MAKKTETDSIRDALEEFVRDIEDTGGVIMDRKGLPRPLGDPDWIDLGMTYLRACAALGRKPKVASGKWEDEDEIGET